MAAMKSLINTQIWLLFTCVISSYTSRTLRCWSFQTTCHLFPQLNLMFHGRHKTVLCKFSLSKTSCKIWLPLPSLCHFALIISDILLISYPSWTLLAFCIFLFFVLFTSYLPYSPSLSSSLSLSLLTLGTSETGVRVVLCWAVISASVRHCVCVSVLCAHLHIYFSGCARLCLLLWTCVRAHGYC